MDYSPRFAGAVPLDALAARRPATQPEGDAATAGPAEANGSGPITIVEVTEATFQQEVVDRSMSVPVVIDFWASWCGPCKQLGPVLEKLAREGGGTWVLAKVDCDANQRLAAAAGVQGIPAVKAVWQGGIVGEFTGAVPEPQVRGWLNELLAATSGKAGAAGAAGAADGETVGSTLEDSPAYAEAASAFEKGDYDAAERAYEAILSNTPGEPAASMALAGVRLFRRAEKLDPVTTVQAADAAPDDVDAQLDAADVDMLAGRLAEAFDRLVKVVGRTGGADRDRARVHLLGLFEAVGPDEPELGPARAALSRALF